MDSTKNIEKYIQDRLKQARFESGLSQTEAADFLKRHQSFVSRSENGSRRVDIIDLIQFGKIYHKPIKYFLPKDLISETSKEESL